MKGFFRPWMLAPSLAVLALWVLVAYAPSRATIDDAEQRLEDAQANQQDAAAERQDLSAFAADESGLTSRTAVLALALPETAEVGGFVQRIEAMAVDAGLAIEVVAPNGVSDSTTFDDNAQLPDGISAVSIDIGATGTYAQITDFVAQLETSERLVLVDALSITTVDDTPDLLSVDLTVRVFTTEDLVEDDEFDPFGLDDDAGELDEEGGS